MTDNVPTDNVYTRPAVTRKASGCPVTGLGGEFDPFTDPYLSNPYEFFCRARLQEPVFYSPEIDHWVVARYDDIKRILLDPATFSPDRLFVVIPDNQNELVGG
jgi:cytochrome P450